MAIKRNAPIQKLDGAVEAAVSGNDPVMAGLSKIRKAKRQTPGQRRKAERDHQRTKATYDLPEDVKDMVDQIAHHFSIPVSQVVTVLLVYGLDLMVKGDLILENFELKPSRSPRYDWVIKNLPDLSSMNIDDYLENP